MARKKAKHIKKDKNSIRIIISFVLFCIFILICVYLFIYFYSDNDAKILNEIEIDESKITENKTEKMLKLEELQRKYENIIGWLEIEETNINYPVMQTVDNEFYITHNYKGEEAASGALFLDKKFDLKKPSTNYLIYGHRMRNGTMFEDLYKYREKDFYEKHKKIKFITNKEEAEYEIIATFYSRVYYKSEKNVFRYYFFIDANNEKEFNEYVENCKKASIYDTGITAEYGDQLITLSTCEYSQEDGRFAVVARKK